MASYQDYIGKKVDASFRRANARANRVADIADRFNAIANKTFAKIVNALFPKGIEKQVRQKNEAENVTGYKVPKMPTVFSAKNILAGVARFLDSKSRETLDRLAQKTRNATTDERLKAYHQLNSYLDKRRAIMEGFAKKLQAGKLGVDEFELAMQREIRRVHLAASFVGQGGALNMTDQRMQLLDEAIQKQMQYLERFTNELKAKLKRNEPISMKDVRRAGMYADSAYTTAQQSLRSFVQEEFGDESQERRVLGASEHCDGCVDEAAKGWQPVGTLTPIGGKECGNRCHCEFQFRLKQSKEDW